MAIDRDAHEQNHKSWNAITPVHNSHKRDQAAFLREGGTTLHGRDRVGRRCARQAIPAPAVQLRTGRSRSLSSRRNGNRSRYQRFGHRNRPAALQSMQAFPPPFNGLMCTTRPANERGERFDIVFASYGAICWLSNLTEWARGIAGVLAPGSRFELLEFHPVLQGLGEDWTAKYNAIGGQQDVWEEGIGDYVGEAKEALAPSGFEPGIAEFKNPEASVEFSWSVGEVVSALLDMGLRCAPSGSTPTATDLHRSKASRHCPADVSPCRTDAP